MLRLKKTCIFEETPREEWIKEATKAKSSIVIF